MKKIAVVFSLLAVLAWAGLPSTAKAADDAARTGQVHFIRLKVNLNIPPGFSNVIRPLFDSRGRFEASAS